MTHRLCLQSLRVFDERIIECKLEADSVAQVHLDANSGGAFCVCWPTFGLSLFRVTQLVAGVMHFLDLKELIRLLVNEDGGDELTDLSDLNTLGEILCVELLEPREVEIILEPQPQPEPEPEVWAPGPIMEPAPRTHEIFRPPADIDTRTFDFIAHFTLDWWQALLNRPDLVAMPAEVKAMQWWPSLTQELCGSDEVKTILKQINPGPLGNSAKLRDFLAQLGVDGLPSHNAYILFANQVRLGLNL